MTNTTNHTTHSHQPAEEWNDDEEIVRTEIPERKRSGFDRVSFISELRKNTPSEPGKFTMGSSKSKQTAEFGKHARSRKNAGKLNTHQKMPHNSIRGIHHISPLALYIGAIITSLFYFSIVLVILDLLFACLTFEVGMRDLVALGFLLFMTLLFVTAARSCHCGICKASFFGSGKLNRHGLSHNLPFLGRTLSTALHAIFLFWLRCPACGTPTRLIARKDK